MFSCFFSLHLPPLKGICSPLQRLQVERYFLYTIYVITVSAKYKKKLSDSILIFSTVCRGQQRGWRRTGRWSYRKIIFQPFGRRKCFRCSVFWGQTTAATALYEQQFADPPAGVGDCTPGDGLHNDSKGTEHKRMVPPTPYAVFSTSFSRSVSQSWYTTFYRWPRGAPLLTPKYAVRLAVVGEQ